MDSSLRRVSDASVSAVSYWGEIWARTWNLMQVDTNSVVLSITVKEHAELQERIRAVLDSRNHTPWREGCLLDVSMEILRIFVQSQFSKLTQLPRCQTNYIAKQRRPESKGRSSYREKFLWPNFGHIKRVKPKLVRICLVRLHNLHMGSIRNFLAILNCFPEIAFRVIWVFTAVPQRLVGGKLLLALVC